MKQIKKDKFKKIILEEAYEDEDGELFKICPYCQKKFYKRESANLRNFVIKKFCSYSCQKDYFNALKKKKKEQIAEKINWKN